MLYSLKSTSQFSLFILTISLFTYCNNQKQTTVNNVQNDTIASDTLWEVEAATFEEEETNNWNISKGSTYLNKQPERIKTVLCFAGDSEMNAPLIRLNRSDGITVKFDYLDGNGPNLSYRIVHCDARWNPSEIPVNDYLDGTHVLPINNITNSFNTATSFTHYTIKVPDDYNTLKLAGNYLVQIFRDDQPDNTILQVPFYVVNQQVGIQANMMAPSLNDARNYMQNIHFTIQHPNVIINNPYDDIYVVIQQNGQEYAQVEGISPSFIRNNELVYQYDEPTYFQGGNEYRQLDLKNLNYHTQEVQRIQFEEGIHQAYLSVDEKRTFKIYTTIPDINGRFLIQNDDGQERHTDADYLLTHFKLKFEFPLQDGKLFLAGGFTNNKLLDEYELTYNAERKWYETSIMLKQGYYNYQYVALLPGKEEADISYIEGSHNETENDFGIFVYHRTPQTNTHELIGFQRINSVK